MAYMHMSVRRDDKATKCDIKGIQKYIFGLEKNNFTTKSLNLSFLLLTIIIEATSIVPTLIV